MCKAAGDYVVYMDKRDPAWACERHVGVVAFSLLENRTEAERKRGKHPRVALAGDSEAPCLAFRGLPRVYVRV